MYDWRGPAGLAIGKLTTRNFFPSEEFPASPIGKQRSGLQFTGIGLSNMDRSGFSKGNFELAIGIWPGLLPGRLKAAECLR
jgi:hypothetical protein